MVEGGGFEPPKAEPADLQSAPFDRSGTPPTTFQPGNNGKAVNLAPEPANWLPLAFHNLHQPTEIEWSPQRDSNSRPADSYLLPLSRPRDFHPGFGVWTFSSPYQRLRLSKTMAAGGWCKVSTLPRGIARRRIERHHYGVARDCHSAR